MLPFFDFNEYQTPHKTGCGNRQAELLKKWHEEFIKSDPYYQFFDVVYVYFGQSNDGSMVKIGQSTHVHQRIIAMYELFPDGFKVIGLLKDRDEYKIHLRFDHLRIRPPKGEVFRYSDEITRFLDDVMTWEEAKQMKMLNNYLMQPETAQARKIAQRRGRKLQNQGKRVNHPGWGGNTPKE